MVLMFVEVALAVGNTRRALVLLYHWQFFDSSLVVVVRVVLSFAFGDLDFAVSTRSGKDGDLQGFYEHEEQQEG